MAAATDRAALRPYHALFTLFALTLAARLTYTIDVVRYMRHQYPAQPVALGSPWPSIVWRDNSARAAGLQSGDRVIAIDGRRQQGWANLFVDLRRKNPGDEMVFSIDRRGQRLTLSTKIQAVAFGTGPIAVLFVSMALILMPWLCFAIGFWVAGTRIRDPRAWILLGILLGIGELTRSPAIDPRG